MVTWQHQSCGRLEILIHALMAFGCSTMMCYSVFKVSDEIHSWNKDGKEIYLAGGLPFLNRKRDGYNFDWFLRTEAFYKTLWMWLVGHAILGQVINKSGNYKYRKYSFIIFSLAFLFKVIGTKSSIIYLSYLLVSMTIAYLTSSLICIWSVAMVFIASLSIKSLTYALMNYLSLDDLDEIGLIIIREILLLMGGLRSISTALYIRDRNLTVSNTRSTNQFPENKINNDVCQVNDDCDDDDDDDDNDDDGDGDDDKIDDNKLDERHEDIKIDSGHRGNNDVINNMVDIVCYNLYLPLIIEGPFMPLKEFITKINLPPPSSKDEEDELKRRVQVKLFRSGLWCFISEIIMHYFYYSAIMKHSNILSSIPLWATIGSLFIKTQMFVTKYFILWSLTSAFALLDGIETVPAPSCGYHIYRYVDMWKSFDIGFYEFLKGHIYIPIGGSKHGPYWQAIAISSVFGFILIWHGAQVTTLIWVLINMAAILLDIVSTRTIIYLSQKYSLRPSWLRRIHSLINVPIYFLSTSGSFLFMCGKNVLSIVIYRLFVEGFPVSILVMIIFAYSIIEFSKDYDIYMNPKYKGNKIKEMNKEN